MIRPILDPRAGDLEDDASSTKTKTLVALAGTLLAEISLPKLVVVWVMLIGFPGLLLGATPLAVSIWLASMKSKTTAALTEFWPVLLLVPVLLLGWFLGRRLFRLAESSFWSLNALAIQPFYIFAREGLRHLAESILKGRVDPASRATLRAVSAAAAGVITCALGLGLVLLSWPATRWIGTLTDLITPLMLLPVLLANGTVLIAGYFAAATLAWGVADATMPQPRDLDGLSPRQIGAPTWRVVHLSDIHTVGERYGFRVESGRSGPRGNERLHHVLRALDRIHASQPLDLVLITGDLTDAGRSAEWAEFFAALAPYPWLLDRLVVLPGNHDVNVVDRSSPARLELPGSPTKRLRQMRTLSVMEALQGDRMRVTDSRARRLGRTVTEALAPHRAAIAAFADDGSRRLSRRLDGVWEAMFPMVLPPREDGGLGVIVLNSNAETHFSFTNALGLVSLEQVRGLELAVAQYPRACWILALHHHAIEYPQPAKALSERIGTALVNGSWFLRRLQRLSDHLVVMHGHRHIDWIGACGGIPILSAPSPVMDATDADDTYFYIHTLAISRDGRLHLLSPERVDVAGHQDDDGAVI